MTRGTAVILALLPVFAAAEGGPTVSPLSTGDSESHATLAPDGRTLYFVKLSPDFNHWTVVTSERTGSGWSEPAVAWFSGRGHDADVSFSPDGSTLYFVSNRPDDESAPARGDTDLFRIRRGEHGWGPAERIRELSGPGFEWFPNQTADGTLYFGSERREGNLGPEGTSDLWRARGQGDRFGPPENLGPVINTAGQDIEPWISPDERVLIFASKGRPDGQGSYDLYVAFRCGGAWTAPRPLGGGINSPAWDFAGRPSPDGATFFFASNRALPPGSSTLRGPGGYRDLLARLRAPGNGLFDIHSVSTASLGLDAPCPEDAMPTPQTSLPPDAETVAALDTEYQAAVFRNDATTMARILADDFVLVLGNGTVQTKADLLQEARDGVIQWEEQREIEGTQKVRVWGDTAVVTAKLWVKGTQGGRAFDRQLWFSDTYVRTATGWRYAFGQASLALPPAP